jgi:hypothetical protein
MFRLTGGLAFVTVLTLVSIWTFAAGALANEGGKDSRDRLDGPRDSSSWESLIGLRLADRKPVDIHHLVVIDFANTTFTVPLKNSVFGDNADRISGLNRIPVLGGLFSDRPDRGDFAKGKEIGSVYRYGNALMVVLSPRIMETTASSSKDLGIDEKALDDMLDKALRDGVATPRSQTAIAIPDGEPIILGGLRVANRSILFDIRSDQLVRDDPKSGVPILGKIPLLGSLFRDKVGDAYRDRDRLMILISPTVLRGEYE